MQGIEYYISCIDPQNRNRWVTNVYEDGTPSFEEYAPPFAFKAREASEYSIKLNNLGWIPIVVKCDSYFLGSERFKNIPVVEKYY